MRLKSTLTKTNKSNLGRASLAVGALLVFGTHSGFAQDTTFTYQGQFTDEGAPATGICDLRFTVYDALSAGNPVGSVVDVNDLGVTNGLFTMTLDPGAGVFPGAARWTILKMQGTENAELKQRLTALEKNFRQQKSN